MSTWRENELKKAREKLFEIFEILSLLGMEGDIETLVFVVRSIDRNLQVEREKND